MTETTELYVFDPTNFKGHILNSMVNGFLRYRETPTTLEEYKKEEKNENLIAIDWETFERDYYRPYLNSLCGPFEEITKEAWWDALECLPPARWTRTGGGEFFFISECFTADLYSCYVRRGDKYYSALRPIGTKDADLYNMVEYRP